MSDFVLMTDSSCDLPGRLAASMEIAVVPLSVTVENGATYKNYLDHREIPIKAFYDLERAGKTATTAAPSMGDFVAAMEPALQAGQDILFLGFSSALSASYQNGAMAMNDLREKYPGRKLIAVDSLCASLGQGLLTYLMWQERQKGRSIEAVAAFAEETKPYLCHWFTVNDLNHLHRGGRVSKTTAIIGTALQMKPLMHCDAEGRLTKITAVRGRKASLVAMKDKLKETIVHPEDQTIFISHGDCLEEAQLLAGLIRQEVPVKDVIINHVGPVIGAHTGPGVMALFHVGTRR
jgi:DegV family protein with EDD domain